MSGRNERENRFLTKPRLNTKDPAVMESEEGCQKVVERIVSLKTDGRGLPRLLIKRSTVLLPNHDHIESSESESEESTDGEMSSSADEEFNRIIKVAGLPLSTLYDKEGFNEKVIDLICGTFGIASNRIDSIEREPIFNDGKEIDVLAVIKFESIDQRESIVDQRDKLQPPIQIVEPGDPEESVSEVVSAEQEKLETRGLNDKEYVVEDEIDDEEGRARNSNYDEEHENLGSIREPSVIEAAEPMSEDPATEGIKNADEEGHEMEGEEEEDDERNTGTPLEDDSHIDDEDLEMEEREGQEEPEEEGEAEEGTAAPSTGEEGGIPSEKRVPRYKIVWEGAPEFQWRTVTGSEDAHKMIIENFMITDLKNPFIYQSMLRARSATLTFQNETYKGKPNHNLLKRGRLILVYMGDIQLMFQAINGLVFVRTPPNRPRIKIFLPQTNGTMNMRRALENKLGRVIEPHEKSRQLLVRGVVEDLTIEEIKKYLPLPMNLEKMEIVKDVEKRNCAVLTFDTPGNAIQTHMDCPFLKLGEKSDFKKDERRWCKIFFMEDILIGPFVLRGELSHRRNQYRYNNSGGPDRTDRHTERSKRTERSPDSSRGRRNSVSKHYRKDTETLKTLPPKPGMERNEKRTRDDRSIDRRSRSKNSPDRKRPRTTSSSEPRHERRREFDRPMAHRGGRGGPHFNYDDGGRIRGAPSFRGSRGGYRGGHFNSERGERPSYGNSSFSSNSTYRGGRTSPTRGRGGYRPPPGRDSYDSGPGTSRYRGSDRGGRGSGYFPRGSSRGRPGSSGGSYRSDRSLPPREGDDTVHALSAMVRDQQKQIEIQQTLLKQQEVITALASELRHKDTGGSTSVNPFDSTNSVGTGSIPSSRVPYQAPSLGTAPYESASRSLLSNRGEPLASSRAPFNGPATSITTSVYGNSLGAARSSSGYSSNTSGTGGRTSINYNHGSGSSYRR